MKKIFLFLPLIASCTGFSQSNNMTENENDENDEQWINHSLNLSPITNQYEIATLITFQEYHKLFSHLENGIIRIEDFCANTRTYDFEAKGGALAQFSGSYAIFVCLCKMLKSSNSRNKESIESLKLLIDLAVNHNADILGNKREKHALLQKIYNELKSYRRFYTNQDMILRKRKSNKLICDFIDQLSEHRDFEEFSKCSYQGKTIRDIEKEFDLRNRNFTIEDEDGKCAICLEHWADNEVVLQITCNHYFHERCIRKWNENPKATCPKCRGDSKYKKNLFIKKNK